ncbi:hypothetical protein DPEC_G00206320 [Dallia pectoralis]|uniref:Uncharacterized protein n=1 Tax=Dallia pectoralis TaxID=75939 RepID=A0ACC2G4C3_DALPE|nr:hypothetical protein DPEC_G00206320 [Dallia pectoralis]
MSVSTSLPSRYNCGRYGYSRVQMKMAIDVALSPFSAGLDTVRVAADEHNGHFEGFKHDLSDFRDWTSP